MRAAIAVALGASRDGDAAETLLALLEDPVPAVRYVAVDGLQSLGVRSAAPHLAALAEREAATLAGRMPADLIADRLRTVAALSLQRRALRAAVALDAPNAAPALLEAAAALAIPRDSTAGLEIAAAVYQRRRIALNGLGYATGEHRAPAQALLLGPGGIGDADARLRAVAVRSLGVLDAPGAADRIRPLLGRDPSADVRMTAARVLGLLHDRGSGAALLAALDDPHALVRKEAALALGHLRAPAARARLEALAERDRADAVRDAAVLRAVANRRRALSRSAAQPQIAITREGPPVPRTCFGAPTTIVQSPAIATWPRLAAFSTNRSPRCSRRTWA